MIEPSKSARALAEHVLGRDLPEPDSRPSWEQHMERHGGGAKAPFVDPMAPGEGDAMAARRRARHARLLGKGDGEPDDAA